MTLSKSDRDVWQPEGFIPGWGWIPGPKASLVLPTEYEIALRRALGALIRVGCQAEVCQGFISEEPVVDALGRTFMIRCTRCMAIYEIVKDFPHLLPDYARSGNHMR